jgi:hypothetical protein
MILSNNGLGYDRTLRLTRQELKVVAAGFRGKFGEVLSSQGGVELQLELGERQPCLTLDPVVTEVFGGRNS